MNALRMVYMPKTGAWIRVVAGLTIFGAAAATSVQGVANAPVEKVQMMAQSADPDWAVVTVKPSDPNDKNSGYNFVGSRYVIERKSVVQMLSLGYGVHTKQIMDAPGWASTENWDVSGIPDVPGEPADPQANSLARKLLAGRFGLKMHMEQREMPVYALTLAKNVPKLTPSTHDPNEVPDVSGSGNGVQVTFRYTNNSMGDLAKLLQDWADRPIVDRTGLTGRYDFKLQWVTDETRATASDAPPGLFTAMQEQLGLKLEPVKARADVVVIDTVDRPSAN